MFGLGWDQIIIIVLVGIFLLGPERIPTAVQWVASTVRKLRTMAAGAQEQLRVEIGPELEELRRQISELQSLKEIKELRDLKDLHPRNIIGRNLLGDDFSGGVSGLLGLGADLSPPMTTGSGMPSPDAQTATEPSTPEPSTPEPAEAAMSVSTGNGSADPAASEPTTANPTTSDTAIADVGTINWTAAHWAANNATATSLIKNGSDPSVDTGSNGLSSNGSHGPAGPIGKPVPATTGTSAVPFGTVVPPPFDADAT